MLLMKGEMKREGLPSDKISENNDDYRSPPVEPAKDPFLGWF
jgi:hypothetical protein